MTCSDVVGAVVRETDDSAVVLAGAAVMTELELLEAQDAIIVTPAQPVGRPGPDGPEPHDDGIPVGAHP